MAKPYHPNLPLQGCCASEFGRRTAEFDTQRPCSGAGTPLFQEGAMVAFVMENGQDVNIVRVLGEPDRGGRSREPVLQLQPRYPIEIPAVTSDKGEVPSKSHASEPDVFRGDDVAVEQEHIRSLEVDLAAGGSNAAQSTDFLQRAEERIIVGQAFAGVVLWSYGRLDGGTAHEAPQRQLQERAEGLALLPGLLLKLAQKRFINVQRRLHDATVGVTRWAVSGEGRAVAQSERQSGHPRRTAGVPARSRCGQRSRSADATIHRVRAADETSAVRGAFDLRI
jgi:hypothetical protein